MGLLDWFRPKAKARFANAVARDIAEVVFALHPAAADRVLITMKGGVIAEMEVPEIAPSSDAGPGASNAELTSVDRGTQVAELSRLINELAKSAPQTSGNGLTIMRDRVIWMPSVVTFSPPIG